MKKIKIAQIGTSRNSHGNEIWCCLLRQSDIFEVVGYALPENEREKFPKQVQVFEGYPEMQRALQELARTHLTAAQRMGVADNLMDRTTVLDKILLGDA